jgi:hypothetical protein
MGAGEEINSPALFLFGRQAQPGLEGPPPKEQGLFQ